VISLTLVFSGVRTVQHAYVSRYMLFRKFFYATLTGTFASAVIGIWGAYSGLGVWALVLQQISNIGVNTVVLWIVVNWRPKLLFSFQRLKQLFSFGWKLLASTLIDTVYKDIRQLIIGKMYTKEDLAFYNRGKQIPDLVTANINASIDSVLFPVMSREQNDIAHLKSMTRRSIRMSSYLMWPMMFGITAAAVPLIRLILKDAWLPCVLFLRIFCFSAGFYPIHTANLNAVKAVGRSDLFLKLEIVKKSIGMVALLISMWFGVNAIAYSLPFTTLSSSFVNAFPNKKLIGYSYAEQIKDMLPSFLLSAVMGVAVYFISWLPFHDLVVLILQGVAGVSIYAGLSIVLKFESFYYLKNTIVGFLHTRRKNRNEGSV